MSKSNKIRVVAFVDPAVHRALESMVENCIVETNLSSMVNSLLNCHKQIVDEIELEGFEAQHNQQLNDENGK